MFVINSSILTYHRDYGIAPYSQAIQVGFFVPKGKGGMGSRSSSLWFTLRFPKIFKEILGFPGLPPIPLDSSKLQTGMERVLFAHWLTPSLERCSDLDLGFFVHSRDRSQTTWWLMVVNS